MALTCHTVRSSSVHRVPGRARIVSSRSAHGTTSNCANGISVSRLRCIPNAMVRRCSVDPGTNQSSTRGEQLEVAPRISELNRIVRNGFLIASGLLPNGSRLSCGAEHEGSQTECYHTASRMFSEPVDDGRRQAQALVRQPATTISTKGPLTAIGW